MVEGSYLPDVSHYLRTFFGNGNGRLQLVAEIGLNTGESFVVNQHILKSSSYRKNIYNKVGAIAVAEKAGEYICDFKACRPLFILV